jgi:hypothetical protein
MGTEEKNKVSHRFRAVKAFTEMWPGIERELTRGHGDASDTGKELKGGTVSV